MVCNHSCHRCQHCNKCFSRGEALRRHMKVHDRKPYQRQNANTSDEKISENEDKREFIVYLPEEVENKELSSLIQTLELEIKHKLVQMCDDLKIQVDNIKNLREIKDKKSTIDELNQDIKAFVESCAPYIET